MPTLKVVKALKVVKEVYNMIVQYYKNTAYELLANNI